MTQTWRWKNDSASWSFDIPEPGAERPAAERAGWLRDAVRAVARFAVDAGFAVPSRVSLTTQAEGELPQAVALDPGAPERALDGALARYTDLEAVALTMRLCCELDESGKVEDLEAGAHLFVSLDEDDGYPNLHIFVVLNCDIYAETTHGELRDNRVLARRNGPRLTAFLEYVSRELGARLADIDAPSYSGQVYEHGFRRSRD